MQQPFMILYAQKPESVFLFNGQNEEDTASTVGEKTAFSFGYFDFTLEKSEEGMHIFKFKERGSHFGRFIMNLLSPTYTFITFHYTKCLILFLPL